MNIFRGIYNFFYEIFFGCSHKRQTRPFTLEAKTYKVCLDCGKQIYYSRERMTPLSAREVRRMKAETAPVSVIAASMNDGGLFARRANKSNAAA